MATLVRALVAVAILIAAGRVVAQDLDASEQTASYWVEKIELEQARAAQAQRDVTRLEKSISKAKRRRYPRGARLREKMTELEAAREAGAEAEALLPELFDGARRAGVQPGELRHLE